MRRRWVLRMAAGALALLGAMTAQAGCRVSTAPGTLAFGAYRPLTFGSETASVEVDSQASFSIACNQVLAPLTCLLPLFTSHYTLTISAGGGASPLARRMTGSNGGTPLNYNLYTSAGRTVVWGDGVAGTAVPGSITGCGTRSHTVYGRIPAAQNTIRPGAFSDALVLTVAFSP